MIFDGAGLGLGIEMRGYAADYLDGADSVGDGHDGVSVDALAARPLSPLAVDRAGRVDENPVQIKKNGCAGEGGHLQYLSHARELAAGFNNVVILSKAKDL